MLYKDDKSILESAWQDVHSSLQWVASQLYNANISMRVDHSAVIDTALSGTHCYNPYHNLTHELLVVKHAMEAYRFSKPGTDLSDQKATLVLAAFFHDHNHSGGATTDDLNIERANKVVETLFSFPVSTRLQTAVSTTLFMNGMFPNSPTNFMQECLRDADLCMIYTDMGRKLLLGLPCEIKSYGKPLPLLPKNRREEFLVANHKFLMNATMYTPYGQQLQKYHLDRACDDFRLLVDSYVVNNCISHKNTKGLVHA